VNAPEHGKVVILAMGNRWRGDDAIGPWVLDRLKPWLSGPSFGPCTLLEGVNDALGIVSAWEGAELFVAIDAAVSGAPPGTIHRVQASGDVLPKAIGRCSSHGSGLAEAIALGEALHRLPAAMTIYAVESSSFEPGTPPTGLVQAAGNTLVETLVDSVAAFRAKECKHA